MILFETFEGYTKARWDLGKSHAYRLIQAYQVVNNLSPIGDILPENEYQVRPLIKLDPFEQRRAWKTFLKSGMEITAPNIKKFITGCKTFATGKPVEELTDQILISSFAFIPESLNSIFNIPKSSNTLLVG